MMRAFLLLLFSCLSVYATAGETTPATVGHLIKIDGHKYNFHLQYFKNSFDENEVAVEFEEARMLFPSTHTIVLYGRDIDGDGRFNLWLLPYRGDLIVIKKKSADKSGWDIAEQIIRERKIHDNRSLIGLSFNAVTSAMSTTRSYALNFEQKLLRRQMDLLDLEARVERHKADHSRNLRELATEYEVLSAGWGKLQEDILKDGIRNEVLLAMLDVGLFYGARLFLSAGQSVLKWTSPRAIALSEAGIKAALRTRSGAAIFTQFVRLKLGIGRALESSLQAIGRLKTPLVYGALSRVSRLAAWPVEKQLEYLIRADMTASVFQRLVYNSMAGVLYMGGQAIKMIPYVAESQLLQVVAEVYNRREALFSSDKVLVAKNEREMNQNLLYMTVDSVNQATITSALKSVPLRATLCGIVGFGDSLGADYFITHQTDPLRQSFDTHWEQFIGTLQTQVDVIAIQKFGIVGYGVAFVDQLGGYLAYAEATRRLGAYEEARKVNGSSVTAEEMGLRLMFIPILRPVSSHSQAGQPNAQSPPSK